MRDDDIDQIEAARVAIDQLTEICEKFDKDVKLILSDLYQDVGRRDVDGQDEFEIEFEEITSNLICSIKYQFMKRVQNDRYSRDKEND